MTRKRMTSVNPKSLKNLPQYAKMSDEDFQKVLNSKIDTEETNREFKDRIDEVMAKFEKDYDLSDMTINDMNSLNSLCKETVRLEDIQEALYELQTRIDISSGTTNTALLLMLEKYEKSNSSIISNISKLQDELKITRKIRNSSREDSVLAFIENLKVKAKKFYDSRMMKVFCPKCNTLIFQGWFLFPSQKNSITLICNTTGRDGNKCGHKFTVNSPELLTNHGTNNTTNMPDSLR